MMFLCDSCHETTPKKATYSEFMALAFCKDDQAFPGDYAEKQIAKEFYSDYKASTISDVNEYWKACSE